MDLASHMPADRRSSTEPATGLDPRIYRAAAVALAILIVAVSWWRGLPLSTRSLGIVLASTLAFALAGWLLRAVSGSGALAGGAIAFVLWANGGSAAFLALVAVFVLTAGATRLGRARKVEMGLAESQGGRTAPQVVANLYPAALFLVLAAHPADPAYVVASVAALAEAAADTVSSETGKVLARRTWLITSLRAVAPGTDGGVSTTGTLCGILAAALIAWTAAAAHLIAIPMIRVVAGAAVAGMFLDSILGATLERRRWLTNDGVNVLSTTAAGLLALALFRWWQ